MRKLSAWQLSDDSPVHRLEVLVAVELVSPLFGQAYAPRVEPVVSQVDARVLFATLEVWQRTAVAVAGPEVEPPLTLSVVPKSYRLHPAGSAPW